MFFFLFIFILFARMSFLRTTPSQKASHRPSTAPSRRPASGRLGCDAEGLRCGLAVLAKAFDENQKLLVTSASLLVTSALLVVTRSY